MENFAVSFILGVIGLLCPHEGGSQTEDGAAQKERSNKIGYKRQNSASWAVRISTFERNKRRALPQQEAAAKPMAITLSSALCISKSF